MRAARLIVSDVFRGCVGGRGVVPQRRIGPRYKARPCGGYGKPGTDYYRYFVSPPQVNRAIPSCDIFSSPSSGTEVVLCFQSGSLWQPLASTPPSLPGPARR